jgi:hypothetical protein
VVLELAEAASLLASDQRRHPREVMERCGQQRRAAGSEPGQRAPATSARISVVASASPSRCSRTSDFQVENAIA